MHRSVLRGIVLIALAAVAVIGLYVLPGSKSAKKSHPPDNDPWLLVSYDPSDPYGTYLSNGYISTRVMGDGVGSQDGKPLPCFVSGLYDDEKLIPCPTWSDLRFYDGNTQFKIDKDADYKQTLNMKTGILTTEATWRAGSKTLQGKIEVIVSRAEPNIALIGVQIIPNFTGQIEARMGLTKPDDRIRSVLSRASENVSAERYTSDGKPASSNFKFSVYSAAYSTAHSRIGIGIAACLGSGNWSFAGRGKNDWSSANELNVQKGRRAWIVQYTAVATASDTEQARRFAVDQLRSAAASGKVSAVANPSIAAWAKLWKNDIIIDGPVEDQQAIHSCMFYLLQSVREGSNWSIPPMGLSDNAFQGHVFWDADIWMFPSLILQHPELAQSITAYRQKTLPGALLNAKADGFSGAQYAWESGYTGKEDTPGGLVYRYERHINGDVALAQWQYYLATGNISWLKTKAYPVLKATADYWTTRAKLASDKSRYEILQVVPPDENADRINNSAYTNCIAKMNLDIAVQAAKLTGQAPNPKWAEVAAKLYIPYDASKKRFIAFDSYRGIEAKQADTELLAYPLQFALPNQDMQPVYRSTFDFYAPKVMKNGPAMTSSAHAVIAARLGDSQAAYKAFVESYKPFLRGPFNYFNEKRSTTWTNMCFLTGASGPLQAVLYGFAGIKMDYFPPNPAKQELQFKPCLPREWKSLTITGLHWQGKEFNLRIKSGNNVEVF